MKWCRYTIENNIVSVVYLLVMSSLLAGCAVTDTKELGIVDPGPPEAIALEELDVPNATAPGLEPLGFLSTTEPELEPLDSSNTIASDLNQPRREYRSIAENQRSLLFQIQAEADEDFRLWLLRPSEVTLPQVTKPEVSVLPAPLKVTRDEFESSAQFELRAQRIRDKHRENVEGIMAEYQKRVSAYNMAIEQYNYDIQLEYQQRQEQKGTLYLDFLEQSVNKILARSGMPKLTSPSYNADTEIFSTNLVMGDDMLLCALTISVPLVEAQLFKQNLNQVETALGFSYNDNLLRLSKIIVRYNEQEYDSQIISGSEVERSIGVDATHSPSSIMIQLNPDNLSSLNELSQSLEQKNQVDFTTLMKETAAVE